MKYAALVAECDVLIKAGNTLGVAERISKIKLSRVPRAECRALARICRRAGLVEQGIRLLYPIVRSKSMIEAPATPFEICEYAVLLTRNGSMEESLLLLDQIDTALVPEAALYQAFCHIAVWDYAVSAELLEQFLASEADAYSKLIARVNLGASYLATGREREAETLLTETIALAKEQKALRLAGNCLEQRGHYHIQQRDFARAQRDLDEALALFGENGAYDRLLVQKWRAIIAAYQTNSVAPLKAFRKQAEAELHWDSIREADLFSVKIEFDQRTFDKLLFGCPFEGYRAWVMKNVPHRPSATFVLGDPGADLCLDIETGEFTGRPGLNPGTKIHQVLAALTRDFYIPRNMGGLYTGIYPGEYFDIHNLSRVRQLLHRTRKWLADHSIPAAIEQENSTFRLELSGGFGIRVPYERGIDTSPAIKWRELTRQFPPGSAFTAQEACEAAGLPRSSFLRLSHWALAEGLLSRTGAGRATLYTVKAGSSKNAA